MKFKETIAIVCGSFRPPLASHFEMAKHYAKLADYVIVIISNPQSEENIRRTSIGTQITPEISQKIWQLYIDSLLPGQNVKAVIASEPSPISAALKHISKLARCNVILGVSDKGNDISRFDDIAEYLSYRKDINVIDPRETAFHAKSLDGKAVSASDVRDNIQNAGFVRKNLPAGLPEDAVNTILSLLGSKDMTKKQLRPIDETEEVNLQLTDEIIGASDVYINAYSVQEDNPTASKKKTAYNPKKNPDKAVDIKIVFGLDDKSSYSVEIFLDTKTKEWFSLTQDGSRLTPDQLGQFFSTKLYGKLVKKLEKSWPMSDKFYKDLYDALLTKKVGLDRPQQDLTEDGEFRKGNIDKSKSREKDVAGRQIRTNSGRKIVSFSDFGMTKKDENSYFCWPEKGKEFRWSQWADWKKINPFIRMRFYHTKYQYGISMTLFDHDYDNRGIKGYNLTLEPKLQWLTTDEVNQIIGLSSVQKFLKQCKKRIKHFLQMDDEEIFSKINNPDKCSIEQIKKTKSIVRQSLASLDHADTFTYQ